MKTIGFAGQFYTLWDVTSRVEYFTTNDGKTHNSIEKYSHVYIQNLSKDLQFAKDKFVSMFGFEPQVDEALRGQTKSFETEKSIPLPPEYFNHGKYRGDLISECADIDYLVWSYDSLLSYDNKPFALFVLSKHGYVIFEESLMHISEKEQILERRRMLEFESTLNFNFSYTDGQKVEFNNVLCYNSWNFNGKFGIVYNYRFIVDQNVILYSGSKEYSVEEGKYYNISGTIKHDKFYSYSEDKYIERTKILRMKIS